MHVDNHLEVTGFSQAEENLDCQDHLWERKCSILSLSAAALQQRVRPERVTCALALGLGSARALEFLSHGLSVASPSH